MSLILFVYVNYYIVKVRNIVNINKSIMQINLHDSYIGLMLSLGGRCFFYSIFFITSQISSGLLYSALNSSSNVWSILETFDMNCSLVRMIFSSFKLFSLILFGKTNSTLSLSRCVANLYGHSTHSSPSLPLSCNH